VPKDDGLPPLVLKSQSIKVVITNQVAVTTVWQSFLNSTAQQLEADFVFPLPADANFTEFAMIMNGERVKGEIMARDQAADVYRSIVRRARDPGLLESAGNDLFRARVFPIPANGEQNIEICYSQIIQSNAGLRNYTYPFPSRSEIEQLPNTSLVLDLYADQGIKSIISPTHEVLVSRLNDHHVRISFESAADDACRAFSLVYALSNEDFGLNLVAHREGDAPGHFLLLLAPRMNLPGQDIQAKDVCIVLDSSGSMAGEKLEQAKAAIRYCVENLGAEDRFSVMNFSAATYFFLGRSESGQDLSALQEWASSLPFFPASTNAVGDVSNYLDGITAQGNTDLASALTLALRSCPDPGRPYHILLMTDGLPTVGTTDSKAILASVAKLNTRKTRVFAFGVGYDVDPLLLDGIAADTTGYCTYVHPGENIATKVARFYDIVGAPVLTDVLLTITGTEVSECYPRRMPDLYLGSQIEVLGQYTTPGNATVRVQADYLGTRQKLDYEIRFPAAEANPFVPALWARRKVGYLLENIRRNGETQAQTDEVIALAERYGMVTPYTSFITIEPEEKERLQQRPDSGMQFSIPDLDDHEVDRLLEEQTLTYGALSNTKTGKMGGCGSVGGWPSHMEHSRIRFIRLDHGGSGWDDGMDPTSGADINFLRGFSQVTGFKKIASRGESHSIGLLKKYPKNGFPPFVYLTGDGELGPITAADKETLRNYCLNGGLLIGDAGSPTFHESLIKLMRQVFPDKPLLDIADDDMLYQIPYAFPNGAPSFWHHGGHRPMGIKHEGRWCVFYHPGDMNDAWKTPGQTDATPEMRDAAIRLGVNLVYYAFVHHPEFQETNTPVKEPPPEPVRKPAMLPASDPVLPTTGKHAIQLSEATAAMKEQLTLAPAFIRKASGRTFIKTRGVWVDQAWTSGQEPLLIQVGSDAFFALLDRDADLLSALALGPNVIVVLQSGRAVRTGYAGQNSLTAQALADLFPGPPPASPAGRDGAEPGRQP